MAVTEILCRFDPAAQQPVVFLRDTINNGQIQVWKEGQKPAYVPLDYYGMTRHLSAEDERVLMERFKNATGKQNQVVHINHRLPRTSKPTPNMLASSAPSVLVPAAQRKPAAKSIEAQPAPAAPVGNLPQAGERPAELVYVSPVDERPSAAVWRQIEAENAKLTTLPPMIADLKHKLEVAMAEQATAQNRVRDLSLQYNELIEQESAEELRKRKEQLAALSAGATGTDAIAQFAQNLVAAGAQPAQPTDVVAATFPATPAHVATPQAPAANNAGRGKGGRFAAKKTATTATSRKK